MAVLATASEYDIHQRLRRHRAGRTSVLVSHRLSAVREADLIAADGRYAQLFAVQASGYRDTDGEPAPATAGRMIG